MMPQKGPTIGLFYECGGVMLGTEDGGGEAEDFVVRWRDEGHDIFGGRMVFLRRFIQKKVA